MLCCPFVSAGPQFGTVPVIEEGCWSATENSDMVGFKDCCWGPSKTGNFSLAIDEHQPDLADARSRADSNFIANMASIARFMVRSMARCRRQPALT